MTNGVEGKARRTDRRRRWARPVAEILEGRQLLSTITVNSAGDAGDADGSNTLSLRQAIEIANGTLAVSSLTTAQQALVTGTSSTPATIDFDIPGAGPFTIEPATALPEITVPVTVDGYSQPGSSPNTGGPGQGDNAVLQIVIDGTLLSTPVSFTAPYSPSGPPESDYTVPEFAALNVDGGNSTVQGLSVVNFSKGVSITQTDFQGGVESGGYSLGYGIWLQGAGGDVVRGDFVGLEPDGAGGTNGNFIGLESDTANTIGGTAAADRNVVSGNEIGASVNGKTLVEGNFIGPDVTGTKAVTSQLDGFTIGQEGGLLTSGPSNTIGGTASGAGNLLSGNFSNVGAGLGDSGTGTLVEGNLIGTDVTGTKAIPGQGYGIDADGAKSATIGGTSAGAGNVISGNAANGIYLESDTSEKDYTSDFLVEGNFIGTDATGTKAVPNANDGILIQESTSNTIGGTAAGASNVIAFNGKSGVGIVTLYDGELNLINSVGNTVSVNSIHDNGGLGIDLGDDGVTPNVPAGDPKAPNLRQPFPVILSAPPGGPITATLTAAPSKTYTVQFFANPAVAGQPQAFLGSTTVATDASGFAEFTFSDPSAAVGQSITATATDPAGNTSEFAADFAVGSTPIAPRVSPTTVNLIGPGEPATLGQPATFAAVVTTTGLSTPTGFVAFVANGVYLGVAPVDAHGVAVFITKSLAAGVNGVAAYYLSDANNLPSVSNLALLYVDQGGPKVASAVIIAPHTARVTFNRPLLPGPAKNPANYSIIGPDGRAVTITSATYDAADDSVALKTTADLDPRRSFRLKVKGKRVVGITRIALEGDGRKPGTDFVGPFDFLAQS